MEPEPTDKTPKRQPQSANTTKAGSKGKASPKTPESRRASAKSGKSTPNLTKRSSEQRHLERGRPLGERASSGPAEPHGTVRKETAGDKDKEATPVTPQDRLSKAPTPRPESGRESLVGSRQRDAAPANQNMVTAGREGEGKRSPPRSHSRTRSAVPTPVPTPVPGSAVIASVRAAVASKEPRPTYTVEDTHTPATPVDGQQVLPEQHPRPESAAVPAPGTKQGPQIPEPPVVVAVIDPHEAGRPCENPLMCLYTPEGGLQPMAYALFAFIWLAFVAVLFYFLIRQSFGRTHGACDTPACEAYSRLLLASINSSVKPCESFSRYVCDGWHSGHDLNVGEDTILAALDRVYRSAAVSELPANSQNAMQRATAFYLSCACVGRGECDELQKVKAALREVGIVWPHRASSPAVVKTLLYTSMSLRWPSLLDLEVVPRKTETHIYLRIPPWFFSLSSKLAEHQRSPGARKRYFDVLRYNFKSEGDNVTGEDIVSFEDTHSVELGIVGFLDKSTKNDMTTTDLYMYGPPKGSHAIWIDALREYGVKVGKKNDIVFETDTPTFVEHFNLMWERYHDDKMHMFLSWGTVQVAALFSNQMLQANFYGSASKARVGHGTYCFSKTLLFVGDQALYAYRSQFLPEESVPMAGTVVADVRRALERRVHRWSRYDGSITIVGDWYSTRTALKYLHEEGGANARKTKAPTSTPHRRPGRVQADMGKSLVDNWRLLPRAALSDPTFSRVSSAIEKLRLYVLQNGSVPQGPDLSLFPYAFSFPYFDAKASAAFNYAGVGSLVAQGLGELLLDAYSKSEIDPAVKTYLECMQGSSPSSHDKSSWARYMDPISLKTSLDAYRSSSGASDDSPAVGLEFLSREQLFFVAACFMRCSGGASDSGGFAHAQCDAAFKHVEEFADVFGCPPQSPMNPAQRCTLL
ncbi:endothelin-converting enzyme 1-like [Dermacentor albipictus]|uniref:endothelin-converting enzyme 1-like n=1 Tax=Dermacentor albipictus TaxID=60249 RepID=UPI0031FC587C